MGEIRRYEIDGIILDIPIHYDEQAKIYIEDYPDFIENPIWTQNGYRVLFSGTDACEYAKESIPSGCPDCGSCKYYKQAGKHTWFGICQNEKHRKKDIANKGGIKK